MDLETESSQIFSELIGFQALHSWIDRITLLFRHDHFVLFSFIKYKRILKKIFSSKRKLCSEFKAIVKQECRFFSKNYKIITLKKCSNDKLFSVYQKKKKLPPKFRFSLLNGFQPTIMWIMTVFTKSFHSFELYNSNTLRS